MTRAVAVRARLVAVPVLLLLVAACGSEPVAAPRPVPTVLAPTTVLSDSLGFHLHTSAGAERAFSEGAEESLIDEGRLWEIRRQDRLVGTLQITSVKSDVDLSDREVRDQITEPILQGGRSDIRILGQEVSQIEDQGGLSTLVWFGRGLMLVLQVKDEVVTGPDLAQAVVEHQLTRPEWEPLPDLYAPV